MRNKVICKVKGTFKVLRYHSYKKNFFFEQINFKVKVISDFNYSFNCKHFIWYVMKQSKPSNFHRLHSQKNYSFNFWGNSGCKCWKCLFLTRAGLCIWAYRLDQPWCFWNPKLWKKIESFGLIQHCPNVSVGVFCLLEFRYLESKFQAEIWHTGYEGQMRNPEIFFWDRIFSGGLRIGLRRTLVSAGFWAIGKRCEAEILQGGFIHSF
jgi:hypothetical protein